MKNLVFKLIFIAFSAIFIGCKEQIADDSACPNCPVITKITPEIGQEGNEITIVGQRFGTDKSKVTIDILTEPTKVSLGTNDITSISDSEIKFKVPAGKSGTGKVLVKINLGTDILSSDDAGITNKPADVVFTFQGKGLITNTTPLSGRVNDEVVLQGTNFGTTKEDIKITLGTIEVPTASITNLTNTEIKFKIPNVPNIPTKSKISLKIKGFEVGGSLDFNYLLPKLTDSFISGARDETITIKGVNFSDKTVREVKILIKTTEIPISNIISSTDSEIKVKIPKGIGSGKLSVKIANYTSENTLDFNYRLSYSVSTLSYIKTITSSLGTLTDFKVDTTSGRDAIYLGYKEIFGSSYIVKISSNNDLTVPSEALFNNIGMTKTLQTDGKTPKIFYALYWFLPIQSKMIYQYYSNDLTDLSKEALQIAEFTNNTISPTDKRVINTKSIDSKITSSGINLLYSASYNSGVYDFYELKRDNTGFASFVFSKIGASTSELGSLSDIEFGTPFIYAADSKNNKLFYFNTSNREFKLLSGSTSGNTDGSLSVAKFNAPSDLAIDKSNNLYVCDSENSIIRKISNSVVATIAGNKDKTGDTNGDGSVATFKKPIFISIGKGGKIYVYDSGNALIRVVTPE